LKTPKVFNIDNPVGSLKAESASIARIDGNIRLQKTGFASDIEKKL
jgi:hypothetical protein